MRLFRGSCLVRWAVVVTCGFLPARLHAEESAQSRVVNDRCPVMTEEFASPQQEILYEGVTVRFCCDECREQFQADPVQYITRLPQIPPERMQTLIAGGQEHSKAARAARWIDRWMQPVLLGTAALLTVWVMVRFAKRRRFRGSVAA